MIEALFLLILGILSFPQAFLKTFPKLSKLLKQIEPFTGILGCIAVFFGFARILNAIDGFWFSIFIAYSNSYFLRLAIRTTRGLVLIILGFSLAYTLLMQLFEKSISIQKSFRSFKNKIDKYRTILGILAIILGCFRIVFLFIYRLGV